MTALSTAKPAAPLRAGEPLRIGPELVSFGRNIIAQNGSAFELQHRLFVNDPWELIAEAIHRSVSDVRTRDIAHSFRRQAEDYFRAATIGRELAVRPVLLYYAFLNLSKAYAVAKGNKSFVDRAYHGISSAPKPRAILGSLIKFDKSSRAGVFQELLRYFGGNPAVASSDLRLGHILPQILPGHRLWCYATKHSERFLTVERCDILHSLPTKEVWLTFYLDRNELDRLGMTEVQALAYSDFQNEFQVATGISAKYWVCFQQRNPASYIVEPGEALAQIISKVRNGFWETVKVATPYRKHYVYCCPPMEQRARLPQLLSVYLLMFFLGHVTRYFPRYFEDILDSKFGPLFDTFVTESPMQFLYLMASEILGQEVSKPAII